MRLSAVTVLVVVLLPVALMGSSKIWPQARELERENLWTYVWAVQKEQRRSEELEKKRQQLKPRLVAEAAMIHRLIAGEMTLADAVNRLRCGRTPAELGVLLDQLRKDMNEQCSMKGPSDEELLCRNVMARVERELLDRPDDKDKITRLHGEMVAYLRARAAGPTAQGDARSEAARHRGSG